jgi:succinate-acetate transporter protein
MTDPAARAVTAFATTSFMLGMYQTGILNAAGTPIVLPAAFFFGGLVQIIVAVLEISRGNLFGAAVFGTYGPFWVIFGAFETLYVTSIPVAQLNSALSLFLVLLSIGAGATMSGVTKAGGWVVLVFAVLAWYHAAGDVIAATFGRKILRLPLLTQVYSTSRRDTGSSAGSR